jgi:hypothetical protein
MNYYDEGACVKLILTMIKRTVDFARGENMSAYATNKIDRTIERSECVTFLLSDDFIWYSDMLDMHEANVERILDYAAEKLDAYQQPLFIGEKLSKLVI